MFTQGPRLIPAGSSIPMTLNDPRFASNVPGQVFGSPTSQGPTGTVSNQDWSDNPGYLNGDQCWSWLSGNLNMNQCRVDWREGPRLNGSSGTFHVDQSYINCVGKTSDHADAFQAFGMSGDKFQLTNTHVRAYIDTEATAVYGAGFTGSTCIFWADFSSGIVQCQNVLFEGGERMVTINADTGGTVHINFQDVYFVQVPGFPITTGWTANILAFGGALIVDNWTNVVNATIVNGVIVPGSAIPSP